MKCVTSQSGSPHLVTMLMNSADIDNSGGNLVRWDFYAKNVYF